MKSQRQVMICLCLLGLTLMMGGVGLYLLWRQNSWWAIAWGWHWLFALMVLGSVTYLSIQRWRLESAFVYQKKNANREVKD